MNEQLNTYDILRYLTLRNYPNIINKLKIFFISKFRNKWVSYNNYARLHEEIKDELYNEIKKLLSFNDDFEFWVYEREFEDRFAKYCNKKYGIGTDSGTAALQLSLLALGIKPSDEVITIPNTYIATALAISNVNARPVFVDVDENTFNIDTNLIEDAITEKTKAVLPVHMYGQVCDMNVINKIVKRNGLKLIEDCAHVHGARFKNKKTPITATGIFSFAPIKVLGGIGNGGMVVTNNRVVQKKILILRDPDSNNPFLRESKRTPCYLSSINTAFLNVKLRYLEAWIQRRRLNAKLYNELLENTNVILPTEEKNKKHCYFTYVIRVKKRDKLRLFLLRHKVLTRIDYPIPLHLTKTFNNLGYKGGDFPVAEKLSQEILSLPINPFLREEEIIKIAKLIKYFSKRYG